MKNITDTMINNNGGYINNEENFLQEYETKHVTHASEDYEVYQSKAMKEMQDFYSKNAQKHEEPSNFGEFISKTLNEGNFKSIFSIKSTADFFGDTPDYYNPFRLVSNSLKSNCDSVEVPAIGAIDSGWNNQTNDGKDAVESILIRNFPIYAKMELPKNFIKKLNSTSYLKSLLGMQIAKLERNAFLNGNGNTAPLGILNDARLTNNLNFEGRENDDEVWPKLLDKILDMIHALPNEYKQNACFMMSSYIKNQLDKIKDRDQRYMNFEGKKTLFNYEVHIIDELRKNGNSLDEEEESEVDFSSQGKKPGKKAKFSDNILFGNFKYAHLICDGDSSDITTHDLFDKPNSIGLSMPTNCGAGLVCPEALVRLRINIS